MKKYRIFVTPPKAKKMRGNGKLVIGINEERIVLDVGDVMHFDFEIPDDVSWVHNGSSDIRFDVKLVYSNKEGTKEEVIRPVPEELK